MTRNRLNQRPGFQSRKVFRCISHVVSGVLAMVSAGPAAGQSYSFSAPLQGWSEVALSFGPGSVGSMVTTFGTLSETLYYDAATQTLRQVGSVSLSPSGGSFSIGWIQPPSPAATGAANLVIGGGTGQLNFDTGTQPAISGSNGDSFLWTLELPISGLCSVINNGVTNTGALDYSVELNLITTILSASPTNLGLTEFGAMSSGGAKKVAEVGGMALFDGSDDNTYHYSWNLSSATATSVPEPGSLAILGLGLLWPALVFRRWRERVGQRKTQGNQ